MIRLIPILTLMLSSTISNAIPAGAVLSDGSGSRATVEDCQVILTGQSKAKYLPWDQLPAALSSLKKATIAVNLSLAGASPTLSYAMKLSEPAEGLIVPDGLRVVHKSNIAFVANGDREKLLALSQRIADSPAASFASFRIVDYSSSWRPLSYPGYSIPFGDQRRSVSEADVEIKKTMTEGKAFAVYNMPEEQMILFFPRQFIQENFDADLLAQQKISSRTVARQPNSLSHWLVEKSGDFDKKLIVHLNSWSVVSAGAFSKLYELNHLLAGRQPGVDEVFRNALNECFDISCSALPPSNIREVPAPAPRVTAATAPILNDMNGSGRSRIIAYLKEHRAENRPLTEPFGVRHAFSQLAKLIPDAGAAAKFKDEIRETGITTSEYNLLYQSAAAQERFSRAWRAFLKAMNSEYANLPFTTRNIQRAISVLPD